MSSRSMSSRCLSIWSNWLNFNLARSSWLRSRNCGPVSSSVVVGGIMVSSRERIQLPDKYLIHVGQLPIPTYREVADRNLFRDRIHHNRIRVELGEPRDIGRVALENLKVNVGFRPALLTI